MGPVPVIGTRPVGIIDAVDVWRFTLSVQKWNKQTNLWLLGPKKQKKL